MIYNLNKFFEYCYEVSENIPINIIRTWCEDQSSINRFSFQVGSRHTATDPQTFQPIYKSPHRFYFENDVDAMWFLLRWS